jgi:glycosyltransferase involved in cell wall biosynthesis
MDPKTGGVAGILRNLLPVLDQRGITSEIVCFDDPSKAHSETDAGCIIHRIGPSIGRWGKVKGFRRWLDTHATTFEVIVLHGLWLYNGYAYTKWMKADQDRRDHRKPRTWIMPHGMLDPWFQRSPDRRLKALRNLIYWWLIEKRTIASADLLIFTSEAERDKAATTFTDYRPRRTAILPLGVPEPTLHDAPGGWPQDAESTSDHGYLLALGRIDPKKGFHLLPEVWKRLSADIRYRDQLPDLIIAGPGWETDYGLRLKARIDELGLCDRIRTCGMLLGAEKWTALRSCEALIMPSHQENFGLVAAEAMACGTPVLLSNQVDIYQLITHAGGGISDSDTQEGIERMLIRWMDTSTDERLMMKESARKIYLEQFRISNTADRFIRLLEENVA